MTDRRFVDDLNRLIYRKRRNRLGPVLPRPQTLGGEGYASASDPVTDNPEFIYISAGPGMYNLDVNGTVEAVVGQGGHSSGLAWTDDGTDQHFYDAGSGEIIHYGSYWSNDPPIMANNAGAVNDVTANSTYGMCSGYTVDATQAAVALYTHSDVWKNPDIERVCAEIDLFNNGGLVVCAATDTHYAVGVNNWVHVYEMDGSHIAAINVGDISYQHIVAIDATHVYFAKTHVPTSAYSIEKHELTGGFVSSSPILRHPGEFNDVDLWAIEVTPSGVWAIEAKVNGANADNITSHYAVLANGFTNVPTFEVSIPSSAVNGSRWYCSRNRYG